MLAGGNGVTASREGSLYIVALREVCRGKSEEAGGRVQGKTRLG